jgi:Mg-chelatase subunit ChlD
MRITTFSHSFVIAAIAGFSVISTGALAQDAPAAKKDKPRVEVVFCLDTTGSMGGLIDGAKQKIWSICNKIASGTPTPDLKVGLVAYRDRGDEYVTKTADLSSDLDAIHSQLMSFQAAGGGDEPESVNEALDVALHKINWSNDAKVLRVIFLVGDAPPHMDYQNDVPYTVTCKKAAEKGIIINTIQCGNIPRTTPFWKEIARLAEGRFVQIAQDGGVVAIDTPFDKRLAEINGELAKTSVIYGDSRRQETAKAQVDSQIAKGAFGGGGKGGGGFTDMAKADRAAFNAKVNQVGAWDLIDNIKAGRVKLEDVKTEDLPKEMQKLNLEERKAYLTKIEAERNKLQAEVRDLDRQRSDYITQELNRRNAQSGFDAQVLDMLKDQAKKVNIKY